MKPDTIQFDGTVIRISYHKHPRPRGWWYRASVHEIEWFSKLNTYEAVIRHYVRQLPTSRRITKREQKERLIAKARLTKCGRGSKVRLSPSMAGHRIAGGRDSIYLISENGDQGALRLWTSLYQSYPLRGFRIGATGDCPDYLLLTSEPVAIPRN